MGGVGGPELRQSRTDAGHASVGIADIEQAAAELGKRARRCEPRA